MHIIGAKTSSSEEFLKQIKPEIALIGVGEDNQFGHPNNNVLERLKFFGIKIYRTDLNGEIEIIVNKRGNAIINKEIN